MLPPNLFHSHPLMVRLFVGHDQTSWREWFKQEKRPRTHLVLDPSDCDFGSPGRLKVVSEKKLLAERFYGSLDPLRLPHLSIATAWEAVGRFGRELDIQLFDYRPNPALRHTLALVAQVLQADQIYISSKVEMELGGFPVGPELVELPPAFPGVVRQAQRRAHWMKMLEDCEEQYVDLKRVPTEGCRLGTGRPLGREEMEKLGLRDAQHAESTGDGLFVVSKAPLNEDQICRLREGARVRRVSVASGDDYMDLLCSFADQSGGDIGFGKVLTIDWEHLVAKCLCTAVPPAPVRALRIGSLPVSDSGLEGVERRPWSV